MTLIDGFVGCLWPSSVVTCNVGLLSSCRIYERCTLVNLILNTLSKPRALIVSCIACVGLMPTFQWMHSGLADGPLLDTLLTGAEARLRLGDMTPQQVRIHLIGSATIDMLFPIAYGALFSGCLYRYGGSWRMPFATIPLIGATFDIMENSVHILALVNGPDLLDVKPALTGPKFVFALIAVGCVIVVMTSKLCRLWRDRSRDSSL